jgi:hypothetical protein
MKKKHETQIAMQKAIIKTMAKHRARWQQVAELSRNYDLLAGNMNKIDVYLKNLDGAIDPLRQELVASRTKLVEQLFPVTSVLSVYAFDRGDKKLLELTRVKFTGLEKMKPGQLKNYTRRILKTSQSIMAEVPEAEKKPAANHIREYGLGEKNLEGIQHAFDQYVVLEEQLVSTLQNKSRSRKKLTGKIRDNRLILKRKMDRMMHLFRETDADFYQKYMKSRLKTKVVPADVKTGAIQKPADVKTGAKVVKTGAKQKSAVVKTGAKVVKTGTKQKSAVVKTVAKQKPVRKTSLTVKKETRTGVRAGKAMKTAKIADNPPEDQPAEVQK